MCDERFKRLDQMIQSKCDDVDVFRQDVTRLTDTSELLSITEN